jgi:membrane protein HdeD
VPSPVTSGSIDVSAEPAVERRRTGWDVVLGLLVAVAGVIVLGHVAVAGVVSILVIGWLALIGGVVLAVSAMVGWAEPARRWELVSAVVLVLLGLGFVRNPGAGLLVLTLLAGSLFLVNGIVRIVGAFQEVGNARALLLLNGLVSVLLGGLVLFQWPVSALWFLGTMLGIEMIFDGITTAIVGRLRPVAAPQAPSAARPLPT